MEGADAFRRPLKNREERLPHFLSRSAHFLLGDLQSRQPDMIQFFRIGEKGVVPLFTHVLQDARHDICHGTVFETVHSGPGEDLSGVGLPVGQYSDHLLCLLSRTAFSNPLFRVSIFSLLNLEPALLTISRALICKIVSMATR